MRVVPSVLYFGGTGNLVTIWENLQKRAVMGEHLGMASGEAKQKPHPRCANVMEGCKEPNIPDPFHSVPIRLDGAWSSMVYGRCPYPWQGFGMTSVLGSLSVQTILRFCDFWLCPLLWG